MRCAELHATLVRKGSKIRSADGGVMRALILVLGLFLAGTAVAEDAGRIIGHVTDETGGALSGAHVEVTSPRGAKKTATSAASGEYSVAGLVPGTYLVTVTKDQFSPYANGAVVVEAGRATALDAQLGVALAEQVTVNDEKPGLSVDANANAGSMVLREKELDGLPDDPAELAKALEALAGPMVGPDGAQFEVDGFSNGRVPAKGQIREIRFNRNPFAAEHDAQMSGGFEITTKAGGGKMAGTFSFGFNDESLNARNPFAQNRPPYQRRSYGFDASGPIVPKKLSFTLNVSDNSIDENDLVSATILDPQLHAVPLGVALPAGSSAVTVSPRLDLSLSPTHSLMVKYSINDFDRSNSGVGGFSLPSRAYDSKTGNQLFQVVESGTIGQVASALRFQYTRNRSRQLDGSDVPAVEVLDAFTGGGAQVGLSTALRQTWEMGEVASWALGKTHTLRAGGRLRGSRLDDVSLQNFGGTVAFSGGTAPVLDANDDLVLDASGAPSMETITSLERYRRTLVLEQRGLSAEEVRRRGGGASQLRIAGGDPRLSVDQWELGIFAQDDWRPSANLQVSMGLRYEKQTNISSALDFAPRLYVSWGPKPKDSKEPPKTVLSAGAGIFYDRVGQDLTLQARRFDGQHQQQYVIAAPEVLDGLGFTYAGVSGVPSAQALTAFEVPQTRRRLADGIETPYSMQAVVSVEREIRKGLKVTGVVRRNQFYRMLRSESVPVADGRVYEFRSDGHRRATWYTVGVEGKPHPNLSLRVNYGGRDVNSDTDGPYTFPANSHDLAAEWGPAFWDSPHSVWGNVEGKLGRGFRFSAWMGWRMGGMYNVITGRDNNGDGVYSDRPSFATDPNKPGVVQTQWGLLDPNPEPGAPIIPRNLGRAHSEAMGDLSFYKTLGFGKAPAPPAGKAAAATPPAAAGTKPGTPPAPKARYEMQLNMWIHNLFNSTNPQSPVGNLSSPSFGQSTRGGGARAIHVGVKVNF
jgi:hypothetical protein